MTIDSKCPKKWAFVDLETGDVWVHKSRIPRYKDYKYNDFFRADEKAIQALVAVAVLNVAHKIKELE